MKSLMLFFLTMCLGFALPAQESADLLAEERAVEQFSAAGDQRNAAQLEALLHTEFRTVVNRQFGSEEVSLMDKAVYLQLVKDEKIGGDEREVHLLNVEIVGNNATVQAVLLGKKLRFNSFFSLVKAADGNWQIIGDFPHIEQV